MTNNLSAGDRRQSIDRLVRRNTSFYGDQRDIVPASTDAHLTRELMNRVAFARNERTRLETMEDDTLLEECVADDECWRTIEKKRGEGFARLEKEDQTRDLQQQGLGRHRIQSTGGSRPKLPTLRRNTIDACRQMRAEGKTARQAQKQLAKGYTMPDGRIVRRNLTFSTIESRYWPLAH